MLLPRERDLARNLKSGGTNMHASGFSRFELKYVLGWCFPLLLYGHTCRILGTDYNISILKGTR